MFYKKKSSILGFSRHCTDTVIRALITSLSYDNYVKLFSGVLAGGGVCWPCPLLRFLEGAKSLKRAPKTTQERLSNCEELN